VAFGTSAWAAQASASAKGRPAAAAVMVVSAPSKQPTSTNSPAWKPLGSADHSEQIGTLTADRAGGFKARLRIPADTPVGSTALWAACRAPLPAGKEVSTASLTIVD
jgi:hypothetical protein